MGAARENDAGGTVMDVSTLDLGAADAAAGQRPRQRRVGLAVVATGLIAIAIVTVLLFNTPPPEVSPAVGPSVTLTPAPGPSESTQTFPLDPVPTVQVVEMSTEERFTWGEEIDSQLQGLYREITDRAAYGDPAQAPWMQFFRDPSTNEIPASDTEVVFASTPGGISVVIWPSDGLGMQQIWWSGATERYNLLAERTISIDETTITGATDEVLLELVDLLSAPGGPASG